MTMFDPNIKKIATSAMRSGNWSLEDGNDLSGGPAALISFIDRNPKDITNGIEMEIYPYRGNEIYQGKNIIREELNKKVPLKKNLNFIHSPDDEREALEYISILPREHLEDHFCDAFDSTDTKYFLKNKYLIS